MDSLALLLIVGLVMANVLGVAMLVPQALRLVRRGEVAGVSASWIGAGVAINGGWVAYALATGLVGLLPVSMGAGILYVWMAIIVGRIEPSLFLRAVGVAGVVAGLFVVAGLVGGVAGVGGVVASLYAGQFAPAAWSSVVSSDLAGVSPLTWIMALGEAAIWVGYGRYVGDWALMVGGMGAALMSVIVLVTVQQSAGHVVPNYSIRQ